MIINHNIAALNTYRQLSSVNNATSKSLERLSSGLRINRAGDDAAGLAISEKMRGQIRGLNQATRNAQDGISLIQTAEGALNETHSILQRMRELAVQSANDTNTSTDRAEIQKEVDQLAKELTRISNNTEFNTQNLLNGGIQAANLGELTFHIGANADQSIALAINSMDASTLGVARDVLSTEVSSDAIDVTDAEISGTTGAAIVDGASISVSTAAVGPTAATLTGGSYALTTDLSGKTASITINVDGTDYKINDLSTWDGSGDETALITLLEGADTVGDGTGTALSTVANITGVSGALSIETLSTGSSSTVTVTYGGTDAADAATLVGITGGSSATGTDASYTVTFDDSSTSVDVTGLAGTETSIAGTGAFAGLTLTTDGAFDENLAATITVSIENSSAATFSSGELTAEAVAAGGIDVSTQAAADTAVTTIQSAIETVSAERSKLGAYQNRLEHTINNLGTSSENLTAAESRIRDVDMAKEMMEFTKNNIIAQAATAMLAQANQTPQLVLQLLR